MLGRSARVGLLIRRSVVEYAYPAAPELGWGKSSSRRGRGLERADSAEPGAGEDERPRAFELDATPTPDGPEPGGGVARRLYGAA